MQESSTFIFSPTDVRELESESRKFSGERYIAVIKDREVCEPYLTVTRNLYVGLIFVLFSKPMVAYTL